LLEQIGIDAIPMLPGGVGYLDAWLKTVIHTDCWTTAEGVILETQPEWKLYELLELHSIPFTLLSTYPKLIDENDPVGRVWFVLSDAIRVRYQGLAKFVVKDIVSGREGICADEREVNNRFSK